MSSVLFLNVILENEIYDASHGLTILKRNRIDEIFINMKTQESVSIWKFRLTNIEIYIINMVIRA